MLSDKSKKCNVVEVEQSVGSCETKIKLLEAEIKRSLDLANARYSYFTTFKEEFNKNVTPTLERINNAYMKDNSVSSNISQVSLNREYLTNTDVENSLDDQNSVVNNHLHNGSNLRSPSFQEYSRRNNNNNNSKQIIDCEVLFLTDSNLHKMNADIMNHGTVAQKLFCPQIRDIEYIIRNSVCKRKPSKIYIQCGTNDIETGDFNMNYMSNRINNMIDELNNTLLGDDGEIIISSILPRTDNKYG